MQSLHDLISINETKLTQKVIAYLKDKGYVEYTSTLMEAWRMSITGISKIILSLSKKSESIPEIGPNTDYTKDEVFSFAIREARLHRNRGTNYNLFFGAFKYYRQTYNDLILEQGFEKQYENYCLNFVNRCFDWIELGFSSEWLTLKEKDYIDDLQESNRTMTNEKNKYLTIFESCSVPIVILDNDCYIDNLNFKAAQLFMDTIIPGSGYYGGEFRNIYFSWFSRELAVFVNNSQKQFSFETSLDTKEGKKHFQVMFNRMLDVTDKFKGTIVTLHDITELKMMEKEMARLGRLELIGEMAAGIGHEIRNPMTTVRGFLQLISSKQENKGYQDVFRLMIEELDRANSIISEYLTMSKDKHVTLEKHNLNHIIEKIFPLIRADSLKIGRNINKHLQEIPDLLLDEKEIRQLILNLTRNGLEAMTEGKNLTIATYMEDSEVVLAVKDEGNGIGPEVLDKLGTPFFTTKDNGTGLGLAVCYSIAKRHKARIDFKTSSEGTIFCVKFLWQ